MDNKLKEIAEQLIFLSQNSGKYNSKKVGIAISTFNRKETLKRCIENTLKYLPSNYYLVIVEDNAKDNSCERMAKDMGIDNYYRFNHHAGVFGVKNKSIELLIDNRCEHLFLFDDDTWPKVHGWEEPYISSEEPHLARSWELVELLRDDKHVFRHLCGGTVLYYERKVIEDVGGMRGIFGKWGGEHVNLSDRIYNRGWTSWRYQDVANSDKLFYACDKEEKKSHKTAAKKEDFEYNQKIGIQLQRSMLDDNEYVEFRQQKNIVITTFLTKVPDPQRGICMQAKLDMLSALAKSIKHGRLVVLHDCFTDPKMQTGNGLDIEFVKVENKISPYFGRWLLIYQWLRLQNNKIGFVWAVDATDVEQLRDPFELDKDTLYIGQEQSTLNNDWLIKNHPDPAAQEFIKQNKDKTLLNPGTVGGDAKTMKRFSHLMSQYWFDGHAKHLDKWKSICGIGEMGAAQIIAYTMFDKIHYGASVNTLFKGEKRDCFAMWKHK